MSYGAFCDQIGTDCPIPNGCCRAEAAWAWLEEGGRYLSPEWEAGRFRGFALRDPSGTYGPLMEGGKLLIRHGQLETVLAAMDLEVNPHA